MERRHTAGWTTPPQYTCSMRQNCTCCSWADSWLEAAAFATGRACRNSSGADADEGASLRCTLARRTELSKSAESLLADSCTRCSDASRLATASCNVDEKVKRFDLVHQQTKP